jgi:hypothetical protein
MNVPSTSPPKEASHASLVYAGKKKVRYFLNTPRKCAAVAGMRIGRGTEILGENLPHCHFFHYNSHMI